MNRIEQLEESITTLKIIVANELPGYVVSVQLIQVFEYAREVELGNIYNIELLKNLCNFGLPYREIEVFDRNVIESIYASFEEMKKLLNEMNQYIGCKA